MLSVWLFLTPWTVACQASLSMEFSRQEYRSGLPFPTPRDLPNPGIEPCLLQMNSLPLYHLGSPLFLCKLKKKLDHNFWCMGVLEGKSWQQWFLSSKLDTLSESHSSSVSYKYLPALDLALSLEHKFPRMPVKQNALFSLLYSSFNLQTFCVMIVIKEQIPDYVSLFVALLRGKQSSYFDNLVIFLNVNW